MAKLRPWFGLLGMINCLWVALYFGYWQLYPSLKLWMLFPQPAINLIEIGLVGVLGLVSILRSWPRVLAACCGILLTFMVLGAWTLGFFLVPAFLLFGFSLVTIDKPAGEPARRLLAFFLGAVLLQAAALLIPLLFMKG